MPKAAGPPPRNRSSGNWSAVNLCQRHNTRLRLTDHFPIKQCIDNPKQAGSQQRYESTEESAGVPLDSLPPGWLPEYGREKGHHGSVGLNMSKGHRKVQLERREFLATSAVGSAFLLTQAQDTRAATKGPSGSLDGIRFLGLYDTWCRRYGSLQAGRLRFLARRHGPGRHELIDDIREMADDGLPIPSPVSGSVARQSRHSV